MLTKLKNLNPEIPFYSVEDEEFKPYGKILHGFDTKEIIGECKKMPMPENGSIYTASVKELEELDISKNIEREIFGGLDMQTGVCYGYNSMLNAFEYHRTNEINIAVTPMVLILGLLSETDGGKFDTKKAKAFYVPEGTVIEVYSPSLHFCPCQTGADGFFSVVMLNRGTNTELDAPVCDGTLFRKNKWLLAHEENTALINRGVIPGLYGTNFCIKYSTERI